MQESSRLVSRFAALDFRKPNSDLFRDRLEGMPWVRTLEGSDPKKRWLIVKHHLLQAQDWYIPMNKKSSKGGRRPAWMRKKLIFWGKKKELNKEAHCV